MNTFEKIITVNGRTFTLTSGSAPEKIDITPISEANGIYEYKLSVAGATAPMVIKWSIHMQGILSYWCPTARRDRRIYQWYSADRNASVSNLYSGAPVLAVIEQGELNRQTVALSDAARENEHRAADFNCAGSDESGFGKRNICRSVPIFDRGSGADQRCVHRFDAGSCEKQFAQLLCASDGAEKRNDAGRKPG